MPATWVHLHDRALPPPQFERLLRRVHALRGERFRQTYQTTFWFPFGHPTSVVEEAVLHLRRFVPKLGGLAGAEWWLSRMRTTDVQVDFHQDRDEILAGRGGADVHPRFTSVLFLNRCRGGLLAVTDAPANEDNSARAPDTGDFDLVRPEPNRFVIYRGDLTHGVLDANNEVPHGRLPGTARPRLAIVINWWERHPTGVPAFAGSPHYRGLAIRSAPRAAASPLRAAPRRRSKPSRAARR